MSGYVYPDLLVSTDWVAGHLDDPSVRIVESDEDVLLCDVGHIPGAVKIDWVGDLNDPVVRDYIDSGHFAQLMSEKGISNDTTVVFYGDKNNWWACYAFWVFQLFGHTNAKIARHLFVSPKTVRNHISHIFTKLQIADRTQAILRAREAGLGQDAAP